MIRRRDLRSNAGRRSIVVRGLLDALIEGILRVLCKTGEGLALLPRRTIHAVFTAFYCRKLDHVRTGCIQSRRGRGGLIGLVHRDREAACRRVMVRCARLEVDCSRIRNVGECRHCAILTVLSQAVSKCYRLVIHRRCGSCNLRRLRVAVICQRSVLFYADIGQCRIFDLVLNAYCHRVIAGAERDARLVGSCIYRRILGCCTVCSVRSFHIVKNLHVALNAVFISYNCRVC